MSIEIDNNLYNIEDEELDDIEYLEIVSLQEIIKDNPSFIALSDDEIYNNFYDFFKNKYKAESLSDLLRDIINNNNEKIGKLKDYSNYIFKATANKKDNSELDLEEDVKYYNNLGNLKIPRYIEAKNKYFFAIHYDDTLKQLKIKPKYPIRIELESGNDESKPSFPVYYPVYPMDDVNMPIIAAYYKIPTCTMNDYIYNKITSHLFNSKNINYKASDQFTSVDNLVKHTKPSIAEVIKYLQNSFELDYSNIDNILKRFGHSIDFITEEDFNALCDYMNDITSKDKERQSVMRPFKIKKADIINKKLVFFDKLQVSLKLLKLTEKTQTALEDLRGILQQQNIDHIEENNIDSLNIYDIINSLDKGDVKLEEVIENIKHWKQKIQIRFNLKSIDNLIETHNNIEEIIEEYDVLKNDFEYARYHTFDYDKDGRHFVVFYNEIKDIIEGGNEDNYEGVPAILKNNDYEAFEDMENMAIENEEEIDVNNKKVLKDHLEKYWLNLKYKDENGFVELLKIVLPLMFKIHKISQLDINFDLLCDELFNNFRNVPTKFNILRSNFDNKGIVVANNLISDIMRITPNESLAVDLNIDKNIQTVIVDVNKQIIKQVNDAITLSIAWWTLYIQEHILNSTLNVNENYLNPIYVEKWFAYGLPIKPKDKNGIVPYLNSIVNDIIKEKNDYLINSDIQDSVIEVIEKHYKDKIDELRKNHNVVNEKKKVEQGVIAQKIMVENLQKKKYDTIAFDFINALIYMPGVNYKKIHKFLLGCCLQKLDKDFKADNDLITGARKDLIEVKKKFATRKETNKDRYLRYTPMSKKPEIEAVDDDIDFMKIRDFTYDIRNDSRIFVDWIDDMHDKNILLPNRILDAAKDNTRVLLEYIEDYIKIIQTTSRNKDSDLSKMFLPDKINYKSMLLAICKTLNIYKTDDENVKKIVKLSIDNIKNILKDLDELNKITNDDIKQDVDRINAYVVARAMCLPNNPESHVNMYLVNIMDLPQNYVEDNAKNIHNMILNMLKFSKFPTMQENIDFINKKREENKQMKLNILNNKTVEENQLISNLKKAGIKNDLMKPDPLDDIREEDDKDVYNDIYNDDNDKDISNGEKDFQLGEEDYDMDDDMTAYDMGFIYSR
jgi:hypothetical protein